jgi:hypothetical protein
MTGVVGLELEAGTPLLAQNLNDPLDILKSVPENKAFRSREVLQLPVVAPVARAVGHRVEPEIHRAEIERAHLRLDPDRGLQPLVHRHGLPAAGRDVDDGVGRGGDPGQEAQEHLGVRCRRAGPRIAGMEVQDGGAGLGRADRPLGDLVGRDGEVGAHRRRMDRSGDRAADDDGVGRSHAPGVP